jgi:hypothetical protein
LYLRSPVVVVEWYALENPHEQQIPRNLDGDGEDEQYATARSLAGMVGIELAK